MGKKALNKNPDEFYFHMINSKQVDGVHREKTKDSVLTEEQITLMQTQDRKYIINKRTSEKNKIEKLQAGLHLINCTDKPKNTHTFFVDSEKEKKNFSISSRLSTHPSLLSRTLRWWKRLVKRPARHTKSCTKGLRGRSSWP